MTLDLGGLNWLAVIVSAVVYFVIGAAWFTPAVFGKPWMAAIGFDESRPRPEMNPMSYAGRAPACGHRDGRGLRPEQAKPWTWFGISGA